MLSSALPGLGSLLPPSVRPIPLSRGPHWTDDACWPGDTHTPGPGTSPLCPTPQEVPPASLPPISTLCRPQGGLWLLWGFWPAQCPAGSGFRAASPLPPVPDHRGQAQAPHPDPGQKAALPQSCRACPGNHLWPPGPALTNPFCILGLGRVLSLEGAPGHFLRCLGLGMQGVAGRSERWPQG